MTFHWPQIVWVCLMVGIVLANWITAFAERRPGLVIVNLLGTAFMVWLLYEGGFFAGVGV